MLCWGLAWAGDCLEVLMLGCRRFVPQPRWCQLWTGARACSVGISTWHFPPRYVVRCSRPRCCICHSKVNLAEGEPEIPGLWSCQMLFTVCLLLPRVRGAKSCVAGGSPDPAFDSCHLFILVSSLLCGTGPLIQVVWTSAEN